MASLRRTTAQTFATWLLGQVPALTRVTTVAPTPQDVATLPSAAVIPNVFRFDPFQADEAWYDAETDDGRALLAVGGFLGQMELRIYARTPAERQDLEEAVLHALMAEALRPGVVSLQTAAVTVGGVATLYPAPVFVAVADCEWREEFAWENRRFSFLDLDVGYPALVLRDAHTIDALVVVLTDDIDSDVPVETFTVESDGSVGPVTAVSAVSVTLDDASVTATAM